MAAFADVIGGLAGGFNQAHELDKKRQFESEMEHRKDVAGMLEKLAFDPNTRPEVANAAMAERGNIYTTPITKAYKFDPYKSNIIKTAEARQQDLPGLQQPAAPPGGGPQPSFIESPNATMPAGVAGPPDTASAAAAPVMSMPQPPPSLAGVATQGAGPMTVSTPGGPQPMFYTPQEKAAQAASAIGLSTQAQAEHQMATPIYQQGAEGGLNALPISHGGTVMGPPIQNVIPPQMFTGQIQGDKIPASIARKNGIPVPDEVPDDGWVDVRRNRAGMITSVAPTVPPPAYAPQGSSSTTVDPVTGLSTTTKGQRQRTVPGAGGVSTPAPPPGTAVPAAKTGAGTSTAGNTVGGRALPTAAIGIISSQARNYERSGIAPTGKTAPIVQQYMGENGMVPHTTQQVADYQKGFDAAMTEDRRLKMMSDLANKVASNPSPENVGSYDVALVAYHMGMTTGAVKGMRTGKDIMAKHEAARSVPESIQVAVEHWLNGEELSPDQRKNFVDLALQSRQTAWQQAVAGAKGMGFSRFPQPTPGLPRLGLWPGIANRETITKAAKDHQVSYGEARKQFIAAGANIQD